MAKKAFIFAHLLGRGTSASEEDEDKKTKKSKARRAEEDERDDDAEDDPDNDAEEEDPEEDAEDDSDDPDASEEDDPDDDGDDDRKESKAVKNARIAERKRCARIFGSKHAASNPALAASLVSIQGCVLLPLSMYWPLRRQHLSTRAPVSALSISVCRKAITFDSDKMAKISPAVNQHWLAK